MAISTWVGQKFLRLSQSVQVYIAWYSGIEQVTIPPSFKLDLPRPANPTVPMNVTSPTIITSAAMISQSRC